MGAFILTEALFAIWRTLIEERTGIHYEPTDLPLLASKLETRATEAGFESPLDYYYFLRYDPRSAEEFDALVDVLVVNETYFFREADQLLSLCENVIRPLCEKGERPRIWCAACASGEEAITIAIILDRMGILAQVDIVASDIGLKVLARAKAGIYRTRALRSLPPGVMGRWIEMIDGFAHVAPMLRKKIDWRRVNLNVEEEVRALGSFDAILCRNVFIYFSDETIQKVVRTLSCALKDTAPLLVGVSESLLYFGTLLKCEERSGSFFYARSAHE